MKKTGGEENLTLAESFINFQLQLKRKEIEQFQNEVSRLEERNQRLKELKQQLKEEQMGQIRTLHRHLKEQEGRLVQNEVVCREQVEKALQDNMELIETDKQQLEELHSKLSSLEQRLTVVQGEKQIWLDYKMVGSQEHQKKIQELEAILVQLDEVFHEMTDDLDRSMAENIKTTDQKTAYLMEREKSQASGRAFKHLDKNSLQALKDNDWLKKTYAFYKEEVAFLEVDVRKLEEENLELLCELFDHQFSDPKIFKKQFYTKATDLDLSELDNLLEATETKHLSDQPGAPSGPSPPLRPAPEAPERPAELERDGAVPSCSQVAPQPTASPPADLSVLLYGGQDNIQDRVRPGSLKLLGMIGRAVPLHAARSTDDGPEELQTPEDWPVTTRMILDRFK